MSNALSAILQGLERGAGMGLNMYQAMNAEARANRQEQFQRNRAARSDFESDRAHRTQMERYQVADEQWEKTYQNAVEELGLKRQQLDDTREHYRGMRGIYQRQQDLSERKFDNELETQARTRALERLRRMTQAYGLTEDGRELTRDEFYERFQNSPDAGTYLALHGFVEGLYGSDRLTRYRGATAVPVGDGRFSVGVTSADGSFEGVKPATVRGSSDPDDPVMATDPYEAYLSYLPQDRAEALRSQARDDALIAHDRGAEEAALEASYQSGLEQVEADLARAEAELPAALARLAELEANRVEPPASRMSEEELQTARRLGIPLGSGWTTRNSAKGEQWERDYQEASKKVADLQAIIDSAPRRREAYEEVRGSRLSEMENRYGRFAKEGDYGQRVQTRRAEARAAHADAVEVATKKIDAAAKAFNALGKERYGEEFKGHLDRNELITQFGMLNEELQVRLANAPGGIEAAVNTMGAYGLDSMDYVIDALRGQVSMDAYAAAMKDPAVHTATGGDVNQAHLIAMGFAKHMARFPNAPKERVLLALSRGEEPPTGRRSSLSSAQ